MNSKLLFTLFAMTSVIYVHSEETTKEEKTETKSSLKIQKEECNSYVFDDENPQLTTFILTHYLKSCEQCEDIFNYVNVTWKKVGNEIDSDAESYHAQQNLYKTKNYVHILSSFETHARYRDKDTLHNLEEGLGLNLISNGHFDPAPYQNIHDGTTKDKCSKCKFIIFKGPTDQNYHATAYCDTYISLNKKENEELIEKTAQKVVAEKEQAKAKQEQSTKDQVTNK